MDFYDIPISNGCQSLIDAICVIIVSEMPLDSRNILSLITQYSARPALFEPGEARFWDDPHISKSMLEAHLDPAHDTASRRPETIDKEVWQLISSGVLKRGDKVLDLGCGPGLYASRLCSYGLPVTGIDISESSIDYAIAQAKSKDLNIEYRCMNFFHIEYAGEFDRVLQIYGEVGTFSDEKRDELLAKIHRALRAGGIFVFDITAAAVKPKESPPDRWYIMDGGFWRPGQHLVLEQHFTYPKDSVRVEQYIILDESGVSVYRTWTHDYTLNSIKPVLEKAGFQIVHAWNDLTGAPYREGGDWLAIVARKRY